MSTAGSSGPRSLGAARSGTHHWWMQRVTAIALVPLSLWLVAVLVAQVGVLQVDFAAWLARPVNATLMLLTLFCTFYHAWLGLTVVIEDYVQAAAYKYGLLLALKGVVFFLGLLSMLAVLSLFLRTA